eukprot:scaffold16454_cov25-Tisochrysis_lutea.AAC.1
MGEPGTDATAEAPAEDEPLLKACTLIGAASAPRDECGEASVELPAEALALSPKVAKPRRRLRLVSSEVF